MSYPLYHVDADPDTGAWVGKPERDRFGLWVEDGAWGNELDTDSYHCDTYEHLDGDVTETRAIKVWWIRNQKG